ncbi:MAG: hypothetical protein WCP29_02300 [Acidobacteriota bacterium]
MAQRTPAWPGGDVEILEEAGPAPRGRREDGTPTGALEIRTDADSAAQAEELSRFRQAVRTVLEKAPSSKQVWLPSFVGLGAADIASISHKASPLLKGIEMVGLPGAAGLVAVSVHDLKHAETVHEKMDAGGDITWGVQGLLYLSSSAPTVTRVALGFGLVGAATQTTVGAMRIKEGLAQQDLSKLKLGALDLGGGLLWIGWDLLAWEQPLFIGSYILLMVGREAYANRDVVEAWPDKVQHRVKASCAEAYSAAADVWDEAEKMVGRAQRGVSRWVFRRQVLAELRQQPA